MHLRNLRLEQRVILALLDIKNPNLRRKIIATTEVDDFDTKEGREARKFINAQIKRGQVLQRARYTADTPALSESTSKFIRATRRKRLQARNRDEKDALQDVQELKNYRRIRSAYKGLQQASGIIKGKAGHEELGSFCSILEKTLAEVRQEFDQQPMTHYGKGQTKKEANAMYKRLTESKKESYISTGMDALDQHIGGGFRKGELAILSAPRKGGKSAMAINMAINQYVDQHLNILYCSLEMPLDEIEERLAAKEGNLAYSKVMNPDSLSKGQKKKIKQVTRNMRTIGTKNGCRLSFWPITANFTPTVLEAATQGMGYDMIWVDYLTLMHREKMELWAMQLEYSKYFKQMALRQNCVMGLLTQLNENESVKYGTAVEENLNVWLKWPWGEEEAETGEVDVQLALCRRAPPTKFPSRFDLSKMTIQMFPPAMRGQNSMKSPSGKERIDINDKEFRKKLRKGDV